MTRHSPGRFVLAIAILACTLPAVAAERIVEVVDFGPNPGNLRMWIHRPAALAGGAPLVVVAHGCFQTVEQVVEHAGWIELADRHGFALLFPATGKHNEDFGGCFRTWYPEHQKRGAGEPLSIRNQVAWLVDEFDIDPRRVYMAGQSSGGLVTAVMLASYPELFAAGAVQSAYPYRCANAFPDLQTCSAARVERSAREWGDLVREAAPGFGGPRPRVAIWHGAADDLILPANLDSQLAQWADVLGVDTGDVAVDTVAGQERRRYADAAGSPRIETVTVAGMGHAIAIDPDADPACGVAAPYIVDADICAAEWIGRWFGIVPPPTAP